MTPANLKHFLSATGNISELCSEQHTLEMLIKRMILFMLMILFHHKNLNNYKAEMCVDL